MMVKARSRGFKTAPAWGAIRQGFAAGLMIAGVAQGVFAGESGDWVGSWAGVTRPALTGELLNVQIFATPYNSGFANQTIRQVAPVSVGGDRIRLRFSNRFGDQPVRFESVFAGLQQSGASVIPGSNQAVRFGGEDYVVVQPGAVVVSDPVAMNVPDNAKLAVSFYLPEPTGAPTIGIAHTVSYVADGDASSDEGSGYYGDAQLPFFLVGVDVRSTNRSLGAVVTIGDSITQGSPARDRWPGLLASRLVGGPPGQVMSTLNVGIGGNRILTSSPACWGESAVARFDTDVLMQTGVKTVVMMEGVNDLGLPQYASGVANDTYGVAPCVGSGVPPTGEELIEGVKQLAARARARGVRFIGGTISPAKGSNYWTPEAAEARRIFNAWIRTTDAIDGHVDFAAVLADPEDPEKLAAAYDGGDHLHPNAAGHRAMAYSIDLKLLRDGGRGAAKDDRGVRRDGARDHRR